jgi:hypothetical protein
MLALRAIPQNGDVDGAIALIRSVKVHSLEKGKGLDGLTWTDLGDREFDMSSGTFETTLEYWERLHRVIDGEPPYEEYLGEYGELAALGIVKGQLFAPDERMSRILAEAAVVANAQMRVQAFADRRPDRVVWKDRKWEWASLRPDSGTFDTPSYSDLEAREKWFYQAVVESPAMVRRDPGAGSLYWLGTRDQAGAYLDGAKTYKLSVPNPVPAKLFWSVTIYDPETRGEIKTDQNRAALRSLVELKDGNGNGSTELYFGPTAPKGEEGHWIKTIPGKGWFTYFRIYGPDKAAFDASWKPGDFEEVPVS